MRNIKVVMLCGGKPFGPQRDSLEHGAHIVVGTPGRIQDHLQRQTLDLTSVATFVLDEADRMLDMGFAEVMATITAALPEKATDTTTLRHLSRRHQENESGYPASTYRGQSRHGAHPR
jgi:ATP-independent RNA helicase DbpA